MGLTKQMNITLPLDVADRVKALVANGDYASEIEVIREGLLVLQERENAVEQWLGTDVATAYDQHKTDPTQARPLDEAWQSLEAEMDAIDRE